MSDYYFANHVFVTSVKDFEPYLTTATGASNISKDDDLLSSKAFHEVFAAFLTDLAENDPVLADYFQSGLKHPCIDLISLSVLLLHDIRSIIISQHPEYEEVLSDKGIHYYKMLDAFFRYWMRLARFAYLDDQGKEALSSLKPRMLFLRKSVFHIYNALKSHVLEKSLTLETDFSAGFLAGFTIRTLAIPYPEEYRNLCKIPFISAADLN